MALGVDGHDDENENGGDGGLKKDFQWPIWGMRALHYPPPPPSCAEEEEEGGEGGDGDEERMGLGAHKDFSWVTLVLQDEVGGLEVLNSEGKWIDVPPREGTLVVNVGQVSFFPVFFALFFHFFLLLLFSLFSLFSLFFFFASFPNQISISNLVTPLSPLHNKLILLPLPFLSFQYLEHQTNSLFPATIHRVRNKSGQEQKRRYSIPFFLSPNPQATLEVLPNCVKAGEEVPPAINVGDLYIRRVLPARKKHPTSIKWRNVPETEWKYEILYGVESVGE